MYPNAIQARHPPRRSCHVRDGRIDNSSFSSSCCWELELLDDKRDSMSTSRRSVSRENIMLFVV